MAIGDTLLVKPSWSRRLPKRGQAVVVLDPGLSFGTGQHPTTRFCLEQVVACRKPGQVQSFLDIGTGSGILAIAAAKLGFRPVEGFDFDEAAVRIAQENAARNGVTGLLRLIRRDLTRSPKRSGRNYDVICANLIADLLIAERMRILNRLNAGGTLVLAGVLQSQFTAVWRAYQSSGLKLAARQAGNEWESGAFVRG
jgi:ribosomal protein L11 methyltransferase